MTSCKPVNTLLQQKGVQPMPKEGKGQRSQRGTPDAKPIRREAKQEVVLTDYDELDINFVNHKGNLIASISFERIGQQLQFNLMHRDGNLQTGLVAYDLDVVTKNERARILRFERKLARIDAARRTQTAHK